MHIRFGWAVFLGLAASAFGQAAVMESQSRPVADARDPQIERQEPMPHLLYLPPGYGTDGGGKRWPVVLFLHGSGESGHDLQKVKRHGPPKLVGEGQQFPFILVSPQTDHGWEPAELGRLLDSIESAYAVDRSREYVTGLSMGGFGTWDMLAEFANRFAAAVMICGGGDPAKAARIKDTPLWVFHGEKDKVVPIERSRADVEALEKLGAKVQFTTYPEATHDSWTETYSNPEVYRWMLEQSRASTGPAATTSGGLSGVLIPKPNQLTPAEGTFVLGPQTIIQAGKAEASTAEVLARAILRATGLKLLVAHASDSTPPEGAITLRLDPAGNGLGDEGYRLEVSPKGVSIVAAKEAGLFYGVQTLAQMLPPAPYKAAASEYGLVCVSIEDVPRFGWRGYMLDSARHFVSKTTVLNLLDALAMFKINVFHWHLVDDTAWRLAISKYPGLVQPAGFSDPVYTQAMGYYSADDVREIVERARQLHITIVPEIEMPSHATQAASVLPEASCLGTDGKQLPPGSTGEICLGSDKAIEALHDVLLEVMALFPDSPYIHLGGDEAWDGHWKACSRCQARMAALGLSGPRLLQKWFMDKMNRFVREHGRTSVAWADRLSLGIPEGQIVHGWHAGELEEAVAKGFRAIHSQHDYTYFDYSQGPGDSAFGGASLVTARVYSLDPTRGLTPEQARLVLGTQAQLWTELVTEDRVFAKTFPRVMALAEVAWTRQDARDPADFERRLSAFEPRLDALGIARFKPATLVGTWTAAQISPDWKDLEWKLTGPLEAGTLNVELRYRQGQHALQIGAAVLLENGREIARDAHEGLTGAAHVNNVYHLPVTAPKPDATYTIRARVRGHGGTDSAGEVLLR